jgi:hypothetical protein
MNAAVLLWEENKALYHFAKVMVLFWGVLSIWALVGAIRMMRKSITPDFHTLQKAKKLRLAIGFFLFASIGNAVQAVYDHEYLMFIPAFMLFSIGSPLMVLYYKHRKAVPPADPARDIHSG